MKVAKFRFFISGAFLGCVLAAGIAGAETSNAGSSNAAAATPTPAANVTSRAAAQKEGTVILEGGRILKSDTISAGEKGLINVKQELAPGVVATLAYDPHVVERIEFPENPKLKQALDLLNRGESAEALALIEPVLSAQQRLSGVKGNEYAESAKIKVKALAGLRRESEARQLIDQLTKNADDPEIIRSAMVEIMAVWAQTGKYEAASKYYDKAIEESSNPQTIAAAWCHKGDALMAMGQYDSALLAYLRVPTLYNDQTEIMPQVYLGVSRAYLGIDDKAKARSAFKKLISDFPSSQEADRAKHDLQDMANDPADPSSDTETKTLTSNIPPNT